MSKAVVFDMDGVLADFDTAFRTLFPKRALVGPEWMPTSEEWQIIAGRYEWWRKLAPLPGAAILAKLSPLPRNFYLLTARHGHEIKEQTREWLVDHEIEFPEGHIIFTNKMGKLDFLRDLAEGAFFIDDSILTIGIAHLLPSINAYVMQNKTNKDALALFPDIPRMSSVASFLKAALA